MANTFIGVWLLLAFKISMATMIQPSVKGCTLKPTMNLDYCWGTDDLQSEDTQELFPSKVDSMSDSKKVTNCTGGCKQNIQKFVMVTSDGETVVTQGTRCSLDADDVDSPVYTCSMGTWSNLGTVKSLEGTEFVNSGNGLLRKKRSYINVPYQRCHETCTRRRWWRGRRCSTHCWTEHYRNYKPEIICPVIPEHVAGPGKTTATVMWTPATAKDPEEGNLHTHQTTSHASGSELPEGSYTVTYVAKDSHTAVYCSFTINVKVHRCPTTVNSSSVFYIRNGKTSCSSHDVYGSVCSYTCDEHYQLQGYHKIECLYDRTWSEPKPACVPHSKCSAPATVPYGSYEMCDAHDIDAVCVLVCRSGFRVEGSKVIVCQVDGTWTKGGSCIDIEPPTLTCPPNIFTYSNPKRQPVTVTWTQPQADDNSGQVSVTNSHTSGQLFPVGQTVVSFVATDPAGNQANCSTVVTVAVRNCPDLLIPGDGNTTCSHDSAEGSDCYVTCRPGFRLEGSALLTCQADLAWSDSLPSCSRLSCSAPSPPANGILTCSSGFLFEAVCSLTCDPGYVIDGSSTVVCQWSLTWTPSGTCLDSEPPVFTVCPDVTSFAAELGKDTYVDFKLPEAIDNSNKQVDVSTDPAPRTKFLIGSTNVTATAIDAAGNVATKNFTVTVKELECPNPTTANLDESGLDLMEFACPQGFVYGASCGVSCTHGHPVGGPSSIRCERNLTELGSAYWWYGITKPFCDGKQCSAPTPPTFGALACDVFSGQEVCTVLCNKDYTFPKGDLQSGTFFCSRQLGVWMPREISRNLCIPGVVAEGVELMPTLNYYTNNCTADHEEIKQNFLQMIHQSQIFQSVCTQVTCSVDTVNITCGPRGRILEDSTAYTFSHYKGNNSRMLERFLRKRQIRFAIKISYVQQATAAATNTFYDELTFDLNVALDDAANAGNFNMPELGGESPTFGFGNRKIVCPEPTLYQAQTALCAGCGQGYIYIPGVEDCVVCPVGTYQPADVCTSCLPCPDGHSTLKNGTVALDGCLKLCSAGTSSRSGLQPCDLCARGSYQDKDGQKSCNVCPFGMSTSQKGAVSIGDCAFYNTLLKNGTQTDDVYLNGDVTNDFTLLARVNLPSDLTLTKTRFSLSRDPGAAAIGTGDFLVYITSEPYTGNSNKKQWYHLAAVNTDGMFTLNVDGAMVAEISNVGLSSSNTINFFPSTSLTELTVSEMQMSSHAITTAEIIDYSSSCGRQLVGNILLSRDVITSLVTPSTCDAEDGCASNPCGDHGVCTDLETGYTCVCQQNWFGENCQDETSICVGHRCANGGRCIPNVELNNYTCECVGNYVGALCTVQIVNGGWSEWSAWELCPVTCMDAGIVSRNRTCTNPTPNQHGVGCAGESMESKNCTAQPCKIDGGLSPWSDWTCLVTCGFGYSHRVRRCDNPPPQNGGRICSEPLEEARPCNTEVNCPVNGGYGQWSEWSSCDRTCGGGVRQRHRLCDSPSPQHGGANCDVTFLSQTRTCNPQVCPECRPLRKEDHSVRHIKDIACTLNETLDMHECTVECERGYTSDDDISYTCGMLSNYTWSHINKDNPRGLIYDCTKFKTVEERSFKVQVEYPGPVGDTELMKALIQSNVQAQLFNVCNSCNYTVVTTQPHSMKRSSASTLATIIMNVTTPNFDPETATDQQIEIVENRTTEFEEVAQTIYNNSESIFKVVVARMEYTAVMPPTVAVLERCPPGSQVMGGLCVNCAPGFYESGKVCTKCEVGTYQDREQATFCITCPRGTTTAGKGAQSVTQCVTNPCMYYPMELGYWDSCQYDPDSVQEKDSNIGMIVGLTLGLVAFGALLVVCFILIKRYVLKSQKRPTSPKVYPYEVSASRVHLETMSPPPDYNSLMAQDRKHF